MAEENQLTRRRNGELLIKVSELEQKLEEAHK